MEQAYDNESLHIIKEMNVFSSLKCEVASTWYPRPFAQVPRGCSDEYSLSKDRVSILLISRPSSAAFIGLFSRNRKALDIHASRERGDFLSSPNLAPI